MVGFLEVLEKELEGPNKTALALNEHAKNLGSGRYGSYLVPYQKRGLFEDLYSAIDCLISYENYEPSIFEELCAEVKYFYDCTRSFLAKEGFELGSLIVEDNKGDYCVLKLSGPDGGLFMSGPMALSVLRISFPEEYRRMVEPEPLGYA
jgi:hypothetical protein